MRQSLGEPVTTGWLTTGSISVSGTSGEASLSISLEGPDGSATALCRGHQAQRAVGTRIRQGRSRRNTRSNQPAPSAWRKGLTLALASGRRVFSQSEEVLLNRAFGRLAGTLKAEALCNLGIASLRFDKRLIGQSACATLDECDVRFDTYVEDAKRWIVYLKRR